MAFTVRSLSFALALSVAGNILLLHNFATATQRIRALTVTPTLEVGLELDSLEIEDRQGDSRRITLTGGQRATVLYILSPTCRWCDRNEANILALRTQAGDRFNFVAVGTHYSQPEALHQYEQDTSTQAIIGKLTDSAATAVRFRATPTTIVIDSEGKVARFWEGAFFGEIANEVESYFSVTLPEKDPPAIEPLVLPRGEENDGDAGARQN